MQPWLFCNFLPEEQLSSCFEIKRHKCWREASGQLTSSELSAGVRHFPTRGVWVFSILLGGRKKENPDFRTETFCRQHIIFTKSFLWRVFLLSLRLMDKNWLGKDPSMGSGQPIPWWCGFTPCDTGKVELAPNKAEQGSDTVFPQPLQISQSWGHPLFYAPKNGIFMKSGPTQNEQLCSIDWSYSNRCFRP